jgi:DNA transformation protein and related proteins
MPMPVRPEFREYVLEQLARVAPITSRSMFGGLGIYSEGFFFALLADETLYLKVDETNRPAFEAAGMSPFRPYGPDGKPMRYYELPGHLLEDPHALRPWVDAAISVARTARRGRR